MAGNTDEINANLDIEPNENDTLVDEGDMEGQEIDADETIIEDDERILLERLRNILVKEDNPKILNLRNEDNTKLKAVTSKINKILKFIPIENLTQIRNVMQGAVVLSAELLGAKENRKKQPKEPYWKRRIENDVKVLRKDISRISSWFKGEWKNKNQIEKNELDKRYKLKAKGFNLVLEQLKQRLMA